MTSAPVYQTVLKRLAAVAMAVGTAGSAAAEELATIPLDVTKTLIDAEELDRLADEDRLRLLEVLANDPRPAVRVHIAQRLGLSRALDEETETLFDRLAVDPDAGVRDAVVSALGRLLPQLSGLERTSLIGRWSTSSHVEQRIAAARVLENRFPILWEDVIVDHLVHDPVAGVRAAARQAAHARGLDLPEEG